MAVSPSRKVTCRYLRQTGDQCTAEVVSEQADLLLCTKHLGQALEFLRASPAAPLLTSTSAPR